jgi:hypothetical protein
MSIFQARRRFGRWVNLSDGELRTLLQNGTDVGE